MDANSEYYNIEPDDKSFKVDEEVHFRWKRRQRDLKDDDTMPIHHSQNPLLNPHRHVRCRGQPHVVQLQQQVDWLVHNFNGMFW